MEHSHSSLQTKQQAFAFVERVGECVLFPLKGFPDLFNRVAGSSVEDRRDKAWRWSDELHLEKKLFLSLAIKGRVTLTSWVCFAEVFPERSSVPHSPEEEELIAAIQELGPIMTPELRQVTSLSKSAFDNALKRLRRKMCVAIVEIRHETKTQHIYTYDLTERWISELDIKDVIMRGV
jgi:hypothetical protein